MLKQPKKRLNQKIKSSYTQFESSTSNIIDQSFPRRLVGHPRLAYSRTEFKFNFFSITKKQKLNIDLID
jgi:hypothetical protein